MQAVQVKTLVCSRYMDTLEPKGQHTIQKRRTSADERYIKYGLFFINTSSEDDSKPLGGTATMTTEGRTCIKEIQVQTLFCAVSMLHAWNTIGTLFVILLKTYIKCAEERYYKYCNVNWCEQSLVKCKNTVRRLHATIIHLFFEF